MIKFLLLSAAFFLSHFVYAQQEWNKVPWVVVGDSSAALTDKILVTGIISNKDTGEPIPGASVSANQLQHFDQSDEQGRYLLELPPGQYRLSVRHIGFKPFNIKMAAFSGGALNVVLEEGTTELEELVVTSRAIDSNVKQALSGLTQMNIQEVRTLPTLMGEIDIVKSLQLMPGVSSVGEGSSGFNVRGGRTDQNLMLLNGVPLFNASHALGFVSAFNQDIVKDFSLYKGTVPAQYGGRASSVLDVNTRRGDFDHWQYQGGVGPISTRFTAEGPITNAGTSVLMGGRISHVNWFLKGVRDPNVRSSTAFFYDGFVNVSQRFSENSSADLFFYASQDDFQFADQFGYSWKNMVTSAKWQGLANRKASPSVIASYGRFSSVLIDPSGIDASELDMVMNYLQVKPLVNFIASEQHTLTGGIEAIAYLPEPEIRRPYKGNEAIRRKQVDKNQGVELSIFANDEYKLTENLALSLGLRYTHYAHIGPDTVYRYANGESRSVQTITDTLYYRDASTITRFSGLEPRAALRVSLNEKQSIKISYNRMRQYIHQISNTTAPTPVDLWQVSNEYLPPQIADNYSLGYFLNLKNNLWETSAEVFYKDLQNLVEYKDFPELYLNTHLETELLSGVGRAYGAEIFIRRLRGLWTGWLSYTYAQTEVRVASSIQGESVNGGNWYPSNYNKPHTLNLVLNRRMRGNGAFSLIFSYNSGRPLTAVETSYIVDGTVVPVYSDRNRYNIPNYFRMDLSFTIGNIVNKWDDSLVFSVYNLWGRDNAYSVFYQRPATNFLKPVPYKLAILGAPLPSLTYNFKF